MVAKALSQRNYFNFTNDAVVAIINLDSLKEVFLLLLSVSHRTFIILDALDECTDRNKLLDDWIQIGMSKQINVLVTSQKENVIAGMLQLLVEFVFDLASGEVDANISLYVQTSIKGDQELQELDSDTKLVVKSALVKGAKGI